MPSVPKLNDTAIRTILSLDLRGMKEAIGDEDNLPDIFDLYAELVNEGDLDDLIERGHILYSFCTVLSGEFEELADIVEIDLDSWYAKKWKEVRTKYKKGNKPTEQDAKNQIISKNHYIREKKKAALYRKLSNHLRFGGAKALEMKIYGLNSLIRREEKFQKQGFRGEEEIREKVVGKINSRLKRRSD